MCDRPGLLTDWRLLVACLGRLQLECRRPSVLVLHRQNLELVSIIRGHESVRAPDNGHVATESEIQAVHLDAGLGGAVT